MKVLIGITQDLDSAQNNVISNFKGLGAATDAGPFNSKEEAEKWKNFMMNRRDNYEEVQSQISTTKDGSWFGFTFESNVLH